MKATATRALTTALTTALLALAASAWAAGDVERRLPERRMAVTIDDLPAQRIQSQSPELAAEITDGLLRALVRHRIPAVGFVNEDKLYAEGVLDPTRVRLLERWLDAGLKLGNHGFSHPDLHRVQLADFERDVLRGEVVTRPLVEARGRALRYFRHPFLHTGRDLETKRALEAFLAGHGYRVAPVTIDNSEWIFAAAYARALERGDRAAMERLAGAYVDHMERMIAYYEVQSAALFEREIPQVLLLHANALNAHHLDRLAARIAQRGYRFVGLETALEDPAYRSADAYVGPGGITWLHRWALTRGVDRALFRGEPATPQWVQDLAEIRE